MFDDTTHCPDCSKPYQAAGDHVPRLLTCHHTACHSCLETRMQNSRRRHSLQCPTCNKKYVFKKGISDIQENRYILKYLKSPLICETHSREFILFCNEKNCNKLICATCMEESHENHTFKDPKKVARKKRKKLLKRLERAKNDLEDKRQKLLEVKTFVDEKDAKCIEHIEKNQEIFQKLLGVLKTMVQDVRDSRIRMNFNIDQAAAKIDDSLIVLKTVRDVAQKTDELSRITAGQESVRIISTEAERIMSDVKFVEIKKWRKAKIIQESAECVLKHSKLTDKEIDVENIASSEPSVTEEQDSAAIQSSSQPSESVSSDSTEIAASTTLRSESSGRGLSSETRSLVSNDECVEGAGPVAPRCCSQCNGFTPRKRKMCDDNQSGKLVVKTEPPGKFCEMTGWIPDEQIDRKPGESQSLKTPDVPVEKICRLKLKKVDSLTKRRFARTPRKQDVF